jgi:hypothetical protein
VASLPFDIHRYSQETVGGLVVFGLIFLFVGISLSWIRPWWAGCIAAMLIACLCIFIVFSHYDPQGAPPPKAAFDLSFRVPFWLRSEYTSPIDLIVVTGPPEKPVGIAVFAAFLLQCTNRGDSNVILDSYSIEAHCNSGRWEVMPSIGYPDSGILYQAKQRFTGKTCQPVEGSFESAGRYKSLSPGATIRGWVFLSGPRESYSSEYRIQIKDDVSGSTLTFPIQFGDKNEPLDSSILGPNMLRGKKDVDLTNIPLQIIYFRSDRRRSMNTNSAIEDKSPPPKFGGGAILLGTNLQTIDTDQNGTIGPQSIFFDLLVARTIAGYGYVQATVTDGTNTGSIEDNQLVKFPDGWDWNQDERSVEIVDERKRPIFQMNQRALDVGTYFDVGGMFVSGSGGHFCVFPGGPIIPVFAGDEQYYLSQLKTMFKYPSDKFSGVRDPNWIPTTNPTISAANQPKTSH